MPAALTHPLASLLSAVSRALPAWRATEANRQREYADFRRVLTVNREVRQVFPFFARYTSWPRFMRHLHEVEDLGFGLSRWKAAGPAGLSVTWHARMTRYVPNELIAWQSEAGSTVPISGSIRFEPAGSHRTHVIIRLSYRVPGGRLGRFVAWLFGTNVESALDEELGRVKELIEAGQSARQLKTAQRTLAS
jgi:uncharacterized membrane protein